MKRSLTGIQPSGQVHVGNYLGAIRPAVQLQESYEAYYFIADLHALTGAVEPDVLRHASREVAASFLAAGLDPERAALFRQSEVIEVTELAWILACQTPVGQLDRGHAVKAARDGGREVNAGTLFYPMLMSADILLYDANVVPVGRDQKQHVEIARDVALKLNFRYGEDTLVVPEVAIQEGVGVIPGLDGRKMSKSYGNILPLWASSKDLRKLVMRITTDSLGIDDVKDPDSDNVFALYQLFASPDAVADLRSRYLKPGLGYGHAKQELFEVLDAHLAEPRERYHEWMSHPTKLDEVLARGAAKARDVARRTMTRVRGRVGLT